MNRERNGAWGKVTNLIKHLNMISQYYVSITEWIKV